ncbi:MAG TPA: DegV family protein, partial [Bacillota bacterium]|nr:DegV family protein [Bacillota bacterium]
CEYGADVVVQHLACQQRADELAGSLQRRLGLDEIEVSEVGAVIGAHVGPGMLAVTVAGRLAPRAAEL